MIDRVRLRRYIEERSVPEPCGGCWIWMQSFGSHGYGNGWWPGLGSGKCLAVETAPVLSYIAFRGDVPKGLIVQHSCDNHWCVAPAHLSLGTRTTNMEDKRLKGRAAKKLTSSIADLIRSSTERSSVLAERYGVVKSTIKRIRSGRNWSPIAKARRVGL